MSNLSLKCMVLATTLSSFQAGAAAVSFTKMESPNIEVRAIDLMSKDQRSYKCTLEGTPESGWSLSRYVDVTVKASNLQEAAELALIPYIVKGAKSYFDVVKVNVEGKNFLVSKVTCKGNY